MTTPSKFAANYTYTDQELLDLYREAVAAIAATGAGYKCDDGREFTAANGPWLTSEITRLERRIAVAASSGGQTEVLLRRVRG